MGPQKKMAGGIYTFKVSTANTCGNAFNGQHFGNDWICFFQTKNIHSILFQETKSLSERLTESKKKCLTHLRKIAAGTSEDLLRNLCLCLESSPFGGVDRDPVLSPPRFLHDLVGGDSYNPSYNPSIAPLVREGVVPQVILITPYSKLFPWSNYLNPKYLG